MLSIILETHFTLDFNFKINFSSTINLQFLRSISLNKSKIRSCVLTTLNSQYYGTTYTKQIYQNLKFPCILLKYLSRIQSWQAFYICKCTIPSGFYQYRSSYQNNLFANPISGIFEGIMKLHLFISMKLQQSLVQS
ncbi:hypothetical protein FGO68_gene10613 [Halteria grandinella]|uniref:Uncharacterized protein n=1 Tax=Halteria grandinella TaxID=5974 RepID=A0A8J8T289_HALGN|nr:hypothetical protein FGO68_gene10613 [Halteria grandinella]